MKIKVYVHAKFGYKYEPQFSVCEFDASKYGHGRVIHQQEIEFNFDLNQIILWTIDELKCKKEDIRAESHAKIVEIDRQINDILMIGHTAPKVV
jgi:hypothetical protein